MCSIYIFGASSNKTLSMYFCFSLNQNPFNQRFIALVFTLLLIAPSIVLAQGLKDKMKASKEKIESKVKSDNSEAYECGYIHKESLAEKANPMKALQKGMGGAVTNESNSDLGTAAITFFYQCHLHPQNIMRYPTAIPGWETCGDAVFAGFTNKSGVGLSSADKGVYYADEGGAKKEIPFSGVGTYFQGFNAESRGTKKMFAYSSDGDEVEVTLEPVAPLEILSVDGKNKGEEIVIDGTKDLVIKLANGDADPNSRLHVQMICKLMGTPIIYDVLVTRARNEIYVPKEAFKNFEGSPSPFEKNNTLIVNRVVEQVVEGTPAGAVQTISAYMDWWPVSMEGDLSKGNVLTMGFDTTKNVNLDLNLKTQGEYNFTAHKGPPFSSPPIQHVKKLAVASFVLRGNLQSSDVTVSGDYLIKTKKWFPGLSDATWQSLVDQMYAQFEETLRSKMGMEVVPLGDVVSAEAYRHTKAIQDGATKTFVEVGAGGTKRILTTRSDDIFKDLSITFASDFVSERLINELDVDAVIAVTIDLDFDFESEGLNPNIRMVSFAPNVSYKTPAQHFDITATTDSKSLQEAKEMGGPADAALYQMIKTDEFLLGLQAALEGLKKAEGEQAAYDKIWNAK